LVDSLWLASGLSKYPRNAVCGHTACLFFEEIIDSVGQVPSPGEFFNRLLDHFVTKWGGAT
jgi:hypothetical protein